MGADIAFAEDRESVFVKGEEIADFVGFAVRDDENGVVGEIAIGKIFVA